MSNEQERAEFEAWCGRQEPILLTHRYTDNPDRYVSNYTQVAWEAYQAGRAAQQSQDAERLDWIEANHGCEIIEFADGTWEVNVPVGPFGIGNGMREAIDHARRVEGGQ